LDLRADNHSIISTVMPGFVPGIHAFLQQGSKTWMAGTSPAMMNQIFGLL
jgi:hypothetical protein